MPITLWMLALEEFCEILYVVKYTSSDFFSQLLTNVKSILSTLVLQRPVVDQILPAGRSLPSPV